MTTDAAGPDVAPGTGAAAEAAALFSAALPRAEKYAELLGGVGVQRGIVGPAEAIRIWDRHLLNCGVVARLMPASGSIVDVGSGAGLPGIVLAILLPEARVTLLEPMARRVDFLQECVRELELGNVHVVRGRGEEYDGELHADVVTARAVAPLDKLAVLASGLARPGGRVLAIKGASAATELARAQPVLARLGVTDARVVHASSASGLITTTVVTFTVPVGGSAGRRVSRQPQARSAGPAGARPGRSGPAVVSGRRGPHNRRGSG
jgi:16S rRNA (guanine527-N7)-methyltransferase